LQCWVALHKAHEENDRDFKHIPADALPVIEGEGASATIIAGSFFGTRSPVPTLSDLFYADVVLQPGARLDVPAEYPEQAMYIVGGRLDLGRDGRFEAGQLLVLKADTSVTLRGAGPGTTRLMLLGGEPMDGTR